MAQTCPSCGTENSGESRFCLYCGAPLTGNSAGATTTPATTASAVTPPPPPRLVSTPTTREPSPDFVGLIGVAFFLLIVGIVFTLNPNLLNDFRAWWDRILKFGLFSRPPEGIITSAVLFFAFIGLSNFVTAAMRWLVNRRRFGALARVLSGIGFLTLTFMVSRYATRSMSGQAVLSTWVAILGALIIVYIGVGLFWTTTRRLAPTPEAQKSTIER